MRDLKNKQTPARAAATAVGGGAARREDETDRPRARIIGHRGAAAQAPENTLAAFRRAAALGIAEVEFDVRVSADGHPVLLHDDTLQRTTDGRGKVATTPLAALRGLDAGAWFAPEFAGEPLPTLSEALTLIAGLGGLARVEIKAAEGEGRREAEAVLAVLADQPAEAMPRMLVSSYRADALAVFRDAAPDIPRALIVRRLAGDWRARAEALDCVEIHSNHRFLTRRAIREATATGLSLIAFTVDGADRARRLMDWGVARIISNLPDALLAAADKW